LPLDNSRHHRARPYPFHLANEMRGVGAVLKKVPCTGTGRGPGCRVESQVCGACQAHACRLATWRRAVWSIKNTRASFCSPGPDRDHVARRRGNFESCLRARFADPAGGHSARFFHYFICRIGRLAAFRWLQNPHIKTETSPTPQKLATVIQAQHKGFWKCCLQTTRPRRNGQTAQSHQRPRKQS
jgi:hypothetical protein